MSQQSTGLSCDERNGKQSRRDHKMRVAASQFDAESLMDMPLIAMFFGGKSLATIARWRKNPDPERRFPEPDLHMGICPYWKRGTVIAYRDRLIAQSRMSRIHSTG